MAVRFADRVKDLFLPGKIHNEFGTHALSYSMENRSFFPEVKWPEREAEHSSRNIAEVRKEWSCTSIPNIPPWCGV
jgi:hypothetical protein